ncbi:MAG: tryptophan synthase subunit beta like protein [Proteobacteria bacterium]|nr:tryptophan synthase subunit beta like protein [Pseudomonadota bacterium]
MPYAERNPEGTIIALYAAQNDRAQEFLTGNHPEMSAFLSDSPNGQVHARMQASDLEMARVVEDLIFVLIEKSVIKLDSLPAATRHKINQRAQIREAISNALSDQLFPGA